MKLIQVKQIIVASDTAIEIRRCRKMRRSIPGRRKGLFLLMLICLLAEFPPSGAGSTRQRAVEAPQQSERALNIPGLRDVVSVRRDERGIPYIEARNEADLYLAQGYVTASDRLWQMDLMRRTGRGELSEIFGQLTLEQDKLHRRFGFHVLASEVLANLTPALRSALESYARGVNAFIESRNEQTMPPEFGILKYKPRLWQPADSIVVGKLFFETLTTSWRVDLMRASLSDLPKERLDELLPEASPLDVLLVGTDNKETHKKDSSARPAAKISAAVDTNLLGEADRLMQAMQASLERVGLYAENLAASNNWVVSPKKTITKTAMLANDPHLPPSAPSIWYMTHLSAQGLRVAGVASPGLPGIVIGHNNHISWGATNLGADVQDLYKETFDKSKPSQYMTSSGLREALVRKEDIKVRKGLTSDETSIVNFNVTVTRNGPIILKNQASSYALKWTALDPKSSELEAFYLINRARNWNDFTAALSRYSGPTQNFVYADVDGHIGYYAAGQIPIRKEGDGSFPYEGAKGEGEWVGYVAFKDLPHLYDPPSNLIVTANNRVVGKSYPYNITHNWSDPYRARRIYDLLTTKGKLSADDFAAIQGDTYSTAGMMLAEQVIKSARSHSDSPEWRQMLEVFQSWDGTAKPESRAMPLAIIMRQIIRWHILEAALGAARAGEYNWASSYVFVDKILQERPSAWLPKEFDSYDSLLLACYKEARGELKKRLGDDESQWVWGRLALVRFTHPLANIPLVGSRFVIAPFAQNGASGSVNVGAFVSMRLIADTGDWDKTRQGITLGESGDPSSPHWKDQLESWRTVSPQLFPFSEKKVSASAKETWILRP
jgi:penicillin amidase